MNVANRKPKSPNQEHGKLLQITDFALIYGIGNVGRRDDALGWAVVDALEAQEIQEAPESKVETEPAATQQCYFRNYQLLLEDAGMLHELQQNQEGQNVRVLFVDACKRAAPDPIVPHSIIDEDLQNGFSIEKIKPSMPELQSFTSHSLSLPAIAALCEFCYGAHPEIWLLSIQGYEWALEMGLSARAQANLQCALNFITAHGIEVMGNPIYGTKTAEHCDAALELCDLNGLERA